MLWTSIFLCCDLNTEGICFSAYFVPDWLVHELQPLLQVAPTASAGPFCGPPVASSVPVVEARAPPFASKYSDKDTIVFMRDRIKSLETELKYAKGQADVWRHKAKMALGAEDYLLNQISDASEQLLGELSRAPSLVASFCLSDPCLVSSVFFV